MDAIGKQLHMRGGVYEVRHRGDRAYMLPLIERVRERSFEARVEAIFSTAEGMAWVEQHRSSLRSGTTLNDLDLRDLHAKGDVLRASVFNVPTIAPPRQAVATPSPSPQAEQA